MNVFVVSSETQQNNQNVPPVGKLIRSCRKTCIVLSTRVFLKREIAEI